MTQYITVYAESLGSNTRVASGTCLPTFFIHCRTVIQHMNLSMLGVPSSTALQHTVHAAYSAGLGDGQANGRFGAAVSMYLMKCRPIFTCACLSLRSGFLLERAKSGRHVPRRGKGHFFRILEAW